MRKNLILSIFFGSEMQLIFSGNLDSRPPHATMSEAAYLHLASDLLNTFCDVICDRHTIKLSLLLVEQLEPAINRVLNQLGDAKR